MYVFKTQINHLKNFLLKIKKTVKKKKKRDNFFIALSNHLLWCDVMSSSFMALSNDLSKHQKANKNKNK